MILFLAGFVLFMMATTLLMSGLIAVAWALLIGLLVGAIAKFLMPGKDPGGTGLTILLGIGGSMVASVLGKMLNIYGAHQSAGFIGSILGAMILLGIYRMVSKG
jgi:uncharacterized membrane protein YeaQ/YmgE (transglycosylase-associated protein family)